MNIESKQKPIEWVWVVIIENDKVLLVKHTSKASHKENTYWFPAWRNEKWETNIETAIRELFEETWLYTTKESLIEIDSFIQDYERSDWTTKTFSLTIYLCKKYSWELKSNFETIPERHNINDLEWLNLLPKVYELIQRHC